MKGELDESFAGLELDFNNYNSYTGDEGSDSDFDRINNSSMDIDRSQRALAMFNPTLTAGLGNGRICELVWLFLFQPRLSN